MVGNRSGSDLVMRLLFILLLVSTGTLCLVTAEMFSYFGYDLGISDLNVGDLNLSYESWTGQIITVLNILLIVVAWFGFFYVQRNIEEERGKQKPVKAKTEKYMPRNAKKRKQSHGSKTKNKQD